MRWVRTSPSKTRHDRGGLCGLRRSILKRWNEGSPILQHLGQHAPSANKVHAEKKKGEEKGGEGGVRLLLLFWPWRTSECHTQTMKDTRTHTPNAYRGSQMLKELKRGQKF